MASPLVTKNTVVSITYLIRDESGDICEYRDLPVAYVHGGRSPLLPQIERALEGKRAGHKAVVTLAPDEAFGAHDARLQFTDALDNVPEELRYVGAEFEVENERGERRQCRVVKIENGRLTVDANHPLAGKTLTYEVTIVGIRDADEQELQTGLVQPDVPTLR